MSKYNHKESIDINCSLAIAINSCMAIAIFRRETKMEDKNEQNKAMSEENLDKVNGGA